MDNLASKNLKISLPEWFYFIALTWFLVHEMLLTTTLPYEGTAYSFIIVLPLLITKIFYTRYNIYQLVMSVAIILVGIVSWRVTGISYPMKLAFFIAAGTNVKIEKILKCYLFVVFSILVISLFMSITGVIINLVYTRYRDGRLFTRQAFGSIYPTNFASHVLYIYLFFSYLYREKFGILLCSLGWILSYLVYTYNDARFNAVLLALAATLFYFSSQKWINSKLIYFATFSFPLLGFGSFLIAKFFTTSNPIWIKLNEVFSNRFMLMGSMMDEVPLGLFGKKIKLIGFGRGTQITEKYNYIDNSYFQVALLYGVLFLILILIMFTYLHRQSSYSGNAFLAILLLIIALASFVEENLIAASYNVLCVSLFARFNTGKASDITENRPNKFFKTSS